MNAFAPMNACASHYSGCSASSQKSLAAFPSLRWVNRYRNRLPARRPLSPPKAAGAPNVPARSGGGTGLATSVKRMGEAGAARAIYATLTSWRCGRGVSC
jgi:hypothetical protein